MHPAGAPADWLDSDQGKAVWAGLCAQVAPSRAAWLVQICDLQVDGGGVRVSVPNVAADLPNRVGDAAQA